MKKLIILLTLILFVGNLVLQANPKITKFKIIVNKNNGETPLTFEVDSGSKIIDNQNLQTPSKNEFVFQGWECSANIEKPISIDSVKITAKWLSIYEIQSKQDSILWAEKSKPKVEELLNEKLNPIMSYIYIAFGLIGLSICFLIIMIFLFLKEKKEFRNKVLNLLVLEDGERMSSFIKKISERVTPVSTTYINPIQHQKIDEQQFKELFDVCWAKKQSETPKQQIQVSQSKILYADSIIEGKFNCVTENSNEDTVFELQLKKSNDRVSEFIIFENAKRRVLKNPDFIDGCEKHRINLNPVEIEVEKGLAVLQENGKWQITQKAKVKFV